MGRTFLWHQPRGKNIEGPFVFVNPLTHFSPEKKWLTNWWACENWACSACPLLGLSFFPAHLKEGNILTSSLGLGNLPGLALPLWGVVCCDQCWVDKSVSFTGEGIWTHLVTGLKPHSPLDFTSVELTLSSPSSASWVLFLRRFQNQLSLIPIWDNSMDRKKQRPVQRCKHRTEMRWYVCSSERRKSAQKSSSWCWVGVRITCEESQTLMPGSHPQTNWIRIHQG